MGTAKSRPYSPVILRYSDPCAQTCLVIAGRATANLDRPVSLQTTVLSRLVLSIAPAGPRLVTNLLYWTQPLRLGILIPFFDIAGREERSAILPLPAIREALSRSNLPLSSLPLHMQPDPTFSTQ